jgi:hypothetical protein
MRYGYRRPGDRTEYYKHGYYDYEGKKEKITEADRIVDSVSKVGGVEGVEDYIGGEHCLNPNYSLIKMVAYL